MRLIDADELIEATKNFCERYETKWTLNKVLVWIANAPTVDATEVVQRHGEWLTMEDYWTMDTIYRCSACKEDFVTIDGETPTANLWRYCPHCGADMRGDT